MNGKQGSSLIYSVAPGAAANTLLVKEVASSEAIQGAYANFVPLTVAGQPYVFGYNPTAKQMDVYRFTAGAPWLEAAPAKPVVGPGWDIVAPFVLGNQPHLVCYAAKKGILHLFSVGADLSASQPYEFYRNHEPGVTAGFTTLKAFTCFGQVAFLGYNGATGYVAAYTLAVTATSPPGAPPLLMTAVWSHQWAKGWTRFAFFQLGGENFFLKTNTWKPNVNIDHVLDDLAAGTAEVGTRLVLKDAQELQLVEPLTLACGDPYFVTYKEDGEITLNRIHSDCLGWTTAASLMSKAGAGQVVPISAGKDVFLLVH
jgi:hypothetical protein